MKKHEIKAKNNEGVEVTLIVKQPTGKELNESKLYANKIAAQIINDNVFITRNQVRDILTKRGEWSDTLEKELTEVTKSIAEKERLLAKGGAAGLTKAKGREIALSIFDLRNRQVEILRKTRELDEQTLEAQQENANFDYLAYLCILNEDGEKVFKSVEDYLENNDKPEVYASALKLMNLVYGVSGKENFEKDLPENKFLLKYGFIDDELRLINKEGKLVDRKGRLVNDEGRLVDGDGNYIDVNGNRINEDGSPFEEFQEFLDD